MSHKELAKKIMSYILDNRDSSSEKDMVDWITKEIKRFQKKSENKP